MAPASKSKNKSKDKVSARPAKEQQKASIKSSGSNNSVVGAPTSGYNPISGTFHPLEIPSSSSSSPFLDNGQFRNIDDTDEHPSSTHGTICEYDSVSNAGSCSGESDDPKEKNSSVQQETVSGLDNDRREKIRLKNEKKHQRQKERRAQELHERCSGYLMTRKLEALSQQLVAMGFSLERATLALMLNEGRIEEAVNWLVDGNEQEAHNKDSMPGNGGNLKIDISEELAKILELEVRHKCLKQEVERAVVACEGDLARAEETLCAQKRESPSSPPMAEENAEAKILKRPQEKPAETASITVQQRRNERDLSYSKQPISMATYSEPGNRNLLAINQTKLLADKKWAATSAPMAPSMHSQPTSAKLDVRLGVSGKEGQNTQHLMREPIVMMQRPQSMNVQQNPVHSVSASPTITDGWFSNNIIGVENVRSNRKLLPHQSSGTLDLVNQNSEQFYNPASYKESPFLFSNPLDSASIELGGSWTTMSKSPSVMVPSEMQHSYNTMGTPSPSHPLETSPSIGIFPDWGTAARALKSSSDLGWSTRGLMPDFDYHSIDWALDKSQFPPSKRKGIFVGFSLKNTPGTRMGNLSGSCTSGLRDGGVAAETASSAGLCEWTSPFAGRDMFSLPRQFVTSPSP